MTAIRIERLGHHGDGIASDGSFLPLTLPGETVDPGPPLRILESSADRVPPPCRYFGDCGGCSLQHASDGFLADWKRGVVQRALAARGLEAPFRPVHVSPPGSRRRATFAGRRTKKTVQVGFHARASDRIVDISTCALVLPGMIGLRPALEALTRAAASRTSTIGLSVTASMGGWDIDLTGGKPLDDALRRTLPGIARDFDLARLSVDGEVVALARPPWQQMGRARVTPPPGAFLQATADGEAALAGAVSDALGGASRIADLFSGCGTFALPLSERMAVHAVEGDAAMLSALSAGWRAAGGLHAVTTETRDLFRRPLVPPELAGYDAVVIDPPRAGAEAQAAELAGSTVPRIAAVSCNPVTFARDARILADGGYRLDWVQVVDQFRWSGHVELVACFSR